MAMINLSAGTTGHQVEQALRSFVDRNRIPFLAGTDGQTHRQRRRSSEAYARRISTPISPQTRAALAKLPARRGPFVPPSPNHR